MKCCICGGDVDKHYTREGVMYWDKGHNPDPVKTGEDDRCCDACNTNVVIPARVRKDEPQEGNIYRLTAGPGEPCIAAGNTWEESVADPAEDTKKRA
jgi:hypothetical protein